ncbi:MAG: sugar phosphate isomerase/epimerase family protein [Actinomycetota bacterium]
MKRFETTRRELLTGLGAALAVSAIDGALAGPAEAQAKPGDPPFGVGAITYNVPKGWDLATLLKILPAAGLPAIEFRTTHAHGVEVSMSASQRAEVKQRCRDAGIKQLSIGSVCEFQSPDPAVVRKNVDDCRAWVKLAKDIGAIGVKVRPNGLPKDVPVEKTLEQIGKTLRECGDMARDQGVEIWVEVHGAGTQEPANMRKILDYCGHKSVGANWNSNPTDVKNGSVKESFELLKPFLMSVHINNLWSDYPYRELFSLLRAANFQRYTLCEVGTPVKPEDGALFFQCYRGLWRELARG